MISTRWLAALLVCAGLLLAACSGDSRDGADPTIHDSTTSTNATALESVLPERASNVAATWSLVDEVPSHRKPGLLVRIGLDAYSQLEGDRERAVHLVVGQQNALFAIAPARNAAVAFDAIEVVASASAGLAVWPFVLDNDGRLVRFAPLEELEACRALDADASVAAVEFDERLSGRFVLSEVECRELDTSAVPHRGSITGSGAVALLGLWTSTDSGSGTVDVERLALVDTGEALDAHAPLHVEVVGLEQTVAWRSSDVDDDQGIAEVVILAADGTTRVAPVIHGAAEVPVADLIGPVRVSIDDNGLLHHPLQGPWIDLSTSTRSLLIDATAEFEPTDRPPPDISRTNGSHVLSTWVGAQKMERQEYEGLTFRNNNGEADRDRAREGACRRVAFLGGSFVEAVQTRVDQKPGILAEALLATRGLGCVEVFTVAGDTFTVENHLGNARVLVDDFGVDVLIFSVSALEVCRMDDLVYSDGSGVDPTTPVRWRYVDGVVLEPLSRREATLVEKVPGFRISNHCNFSTLAGADTVEESVVAKLSALKDLIEAFGPGVQVVFTNVKDAMLDRGDHADGLVELCTGAGLDCSPIEVPSGYVAPVPVTDATSYLYRYEYDAHPNVRANQLIATHLVDLITAALQSPAAG